MSTRPLVDQHGRPVELVVTPDGSKMRVIGDVLPPEQRGASVFLDPAGNGSLAGPGDVRNPNSGPPMAMPPQPESILLRENGTWGRLYTMPLPPIQIKADEPEEEAPWYERAWDEASRVGKNKLVEMLEGLNTVWEALPYTSEDAVTEAARKKLADDVMGTLEGVSTLMGPSADFVEFAYMSGNPDAIEMVEEMQANQQAAIGAMGDAMKEAWDAAYKRSGTAGAVSMVLTTLGMEAVGGKGSGALAKVAEKVAEIVRVAKTAKEAAAKLDEAIAAAKAAGASAEEIQLLERARNQRLAQARRDAQKGKDGVAVKKGRLAPNSTYTLNGYTYTTDAQGRIKTVEGQLKLEKGTRVNSAQSNVGVGDGRLPGDHGGHLIGAQFGGFGGYENLTPMSGKINAYPHGEWSRMEKNWSDELGAGKTVNVKIELVYDDDTIRPGSFDVVETINGIPNVRTIENPK